MSSLRAVDLFAPQSSECERVILEAVRLSFSHQLSGAILHYRAERVLESVVRAHVSQLDMFLRSKLHETETLSREYVPKTWLDAFKARWFPRWLLKRFPAKLREIITTQRYVFHVCPHLPARPEQEHVGYLIRRRSLANTSE